MAATSTTSPRRKWLALFGRALRLLLSPTAPTAQLVRQSYDRIASGYDQAWTDHMQDLSLAMLDKLYLPEGARCVDLACGTGFLAGQLAERTGGDVTGVDASAGMLSAARETHGHRCQFVEGDVLTWLRSQPARSADVITCGWALGYTRPVSAVGQIARVLRPGGQVGIIDNSLFSLAGVLWASVQAFAEQPDALSHAMSVRFLPHSCVLAAIMRANGLGVRDAWDGSKTYIAATGQAAIDRLTATGAAAGFEFATDPAYRDRVFERFAEIMEQRFAAEAIRITHRYLGAVGVRR
ncbi:MAG: class I SAM-dependent methyltransferase [Planctomycetota bacterium]|jgi:ubiquinone/menaquinone biosynthesis C-methylase UbiE